MEKLVKLVEETKYTLKVRLVQAWLDLKSQAYLKLKLPWEVKLVKADLDFRSQVSL